MKRRNPRGITLGRTLGDMVGTRPTHRPDCPHRYSTPMRLMLGVSGDCNCRERGAPSPGDSVRC